MLSTHKLAAGAGTQACCSSSLPCPRLVRLHGEAAPHTSPAFTDPSPRTVPATSMFFPSGHKKGTLKATPARLSRLSTAVGSTCLSYLCISNGFLCAWLRAPRSQPGKQLSAQAAFSLPKLFLLGAEVGNAIGCSSTRSVAGQLRITDRQHLGGEGTSPPTTAGRTDNQDSGAAPNHPSSVLL